MTEAEWSAIADILDLGAIAMALALFIWLVSGFLGFAWLILTTIIGVKLAERYRWHWAIGGLIGFIGQPLWGVLGLLIVGELSGRANDYYQ